MITADTSVLVAAFSSWHQQHDEANDALAPGTRLIAHCAVECFSVLTRLPGPHRISPADASAWLSRRFPDEWLTLSRTGYFDVVARAPELGISGGAVYDAIVAATALESGAALKTFDSRATPVYRAVGVQLAS